MPDTAISLVAARRRSKDRGSPLLVAVDGGGGAGKSTLAASLAGAFEQLVIVHVDDFYRPMSDEIRRGLTPEAAYASLFDWQRLEREVAIPLAAGQPARFQRYDWETGRVLSEPLEIASVGIVVIEGVCSLRPELRRYWDVSIYVDTPTQVRMSRMSQRSENTPSQIARWEAAEDFYVTAERPATWADLVVDGVT
jgi:uridine kinase